MESQIGRMLTLSDWVTWGGTEAGSQLVGQPKRRRERFAALHIEPGHGPAATIQQTDERSSGGEDNLQFAKICQFV